MKWSLIKYSFVIKKPIWFWDQRESPLNIISGEITLKQRVKWPFVLTKHGPKWQLSPASTLLWDSLIKHHFTLLSCWFKVPLTKTSAATTHWQRLLTNMTKQWQTQSDQRDGIIQINAYFLFVVNFQWTKNKKRTKNNNMVLSTQKKKEAKLFHIHDRVLKSLIFQRAEKKVIISLWILFIEGFTCTYIHLCTQCVCGMCRYRLTVQVDPTPLPLPNHYTDIHRPLKQDVQKLVFSIKQCRALT